METIHSTDNLEAIFNNALAAHKLIKEPKALRSDYIPSNLPFRTKQIASIGEILAPILHLSKPSNLLIYGKTGTGKTAVTRHVISRLDETCVDRNIPARFAYCNSRITGTEYRTLADLATVLGLKVPFTGLAVSEVLERIFSFIKQNTIHVVLVIDEIDHLVRTHGDNLLYDLTTSSDKIAPSFLSLIGISNDLQFKEELGARVLSRLSEEELVFPPYSVQELKAILTERANLALIPKRYSDAAINLCAALSGAEHGDARRAVDLLRISSEVAEREGAPALDETHVRVALQKIDQDRISDALHTLPIHAKLVLLASATIANADTKGRGEHSSSGAVYQKYAQLCVSHGMEALTTRRVSTLLTELHTLGLVNAAVVNYGRYGRTKKIIPRITLEAIEHSFNENNPATPSQ